MHPRGATKMADNFNVNLGQAAQDAGAINAMPQQIAQNAANTQNQQQLVEQAIEHTKQAKMQTGLQEQGGLAAEKGLVPKEQVIAEIKAILATRDDLEDDAKQKIVDDATQTMPNIMNGYDVARFTSALRESKQPNGTWGPAFSGKEVQGGATDVAGNPINPQSHYQQSSEGEYRQAGDQQANIKAEGAGGAASGKELKEFGKEIDGMLKTRFGATGMLATTIFRADRALNTLHASSELTKQDLNNISTDIAAIYQGGVPGQAQIVENAYDTSLTNLMDTLRHYTGILSGFGMNTKVLADTKAKLTQVLVDMRNSALASMKTIFEGVVAHYSTLSPEDPAVVNVIQKTMAGLGSGLLDTGGAVSPPAQGLSRTTGASTDAGAPPPAAAPNAAPAQKTQSGISYTVS